MADIGKDLVDKGEEEPMVTVIKTGKQPLPLVKQAGTDYLVTTKLYDGDVVAFRARFPEDLMPNYGKIISDDHPLATHYRAGKRALMAQMGERYYVHWERSQNVQFIQRSEVTLVDRPLQRGQSVRNMDGVKGVVTDMAVNMTVQILRNNNVIENVPKHKLYPFSPYVRGQEVLYQGWVGTITSVKRHLYFQMSSGNILYIESDETDGFMNNDPYWGVGAQCPGTQIRLPASVLKKGRLVRAGLARMFWKWPLVTSLYSMDKMTVKRPQVIGIGVQWLCANPFEPNVSNEPPCDYLDANTLNAAVPIGVPSSETLQPNGIRVYLVERNDKLKYNKLWFQEFYARFMTMDGLKNKHIAPRTIQSPDKAGTEVAVSLVLRQTTVDIEWEDGSTETTLSSYVPYMFPFDDDSPCRTGLVVGKSFPENKSIYGIVHPTQADYKMVNVRWVMVSERDGEVSRDLGVTEESIYDIKPHQEYCIYKRGTVVFLKTEVGQGLKAGTVTDLDLRNGKMLIASPLHQNPIHVWPHLVKPLGKRTYWNFFSKRWITDNFIPPTYQIEVPFHKSQKEDTAEAEHEPILLSATSNNNILDKLESSLKDEPQFVVLGNAPPSHYFYNYEPPKLKLLRNFAEEVKYLLKETLDGIWIRAYEDRMDLLSVLFLGPQNTPYEDGLYMFDLQFPRDFPELPPKIRYISFSETVSPLIDHYDGEFCMSSLNWNSMPQKSSAILAAVARIQAVLFHREPYFDAFNIPRENTTPQNLERSRAYNEKIFINVLSSLYNMVQRPHDPWRRHISEQLSLMLPHKVRFLKKILAQDVDVFEGRTYPLFPFSKAFEISLAHRVEKLEELIKMSRPRSTLASVDKTSEVVTGEVKGEAVEVKSSHSWQQGVKASRSVMEISSKDSGNENNIPAEDMNKNAEKQPKVKVDKTPATESGMVKVDKTPATESGMNTPGEKVKKNPTKKAGNSSKKPVVQ